MNRLRNRLILVFLAATLAPLGATLWVTATLLKWNPNYSAVTRLDQLATSLSRTGRELFAQLRREALAGEIQPVRYAPSARAQWPDAVRTFADSGQPEHFLTSGSGGNTLQYLTRRGAEVWVYSMPLTDVSMDALERQIHDAGALSEAVKERDLQRGFLLTYIILAASFWLVSLAVLVYLAHRISRPIQSLTAGLTQVAAGDLNARVPASRDDEVGRAIQAFNGMAEQLKASTERLVTLRQLEGLQLLARKMAHEIKNSLTPIRLTVEEMIERYDEAGRPKPAASSWSRRRRSWWMKSKPSSAACAPFRNTPPSLRCARRISKLMHCCRSAWRFSNRRTPKWLMNAAWMQPRPTRTPTPIC